jgi:FeS assembly SUF system regulator
MVRVTKLADYGILLLTAFARRTDAPCLAASTLAEETGLPLPTVGKLLRTLGKAGVLESQRGAHGGYRLARPAEQVSVADVITALEGPIALTECLTHAAHHCEVEASCRTRSNWDRINAAIRQALGAITLAEMARPQAGWRERLGASLMAAPAARSDRR